MKNTLLTVLVSMFAPCFVSAQVEQANRLILHDKDGNTVAYNLQKTEYMDFDRVDDLSVSATVRDESITATGFTVNVTPGAGCVSYKVTYSVAAEGEPCEAGVYEGVQDVEIAMLLPSTAYTVSVTPEDKYGITGEAATLSVTTLKEEVPVADPKVGDYFYSDGTYSDGGLISMDADGQNAVWASPRPAPIEGKTVIGIVFNTNPGRMAKADIDAGYTKGYVIACKNATDPNKSNYAEWPETIWYAGRHITSIEVNNGTKLGSSWYANLDGRTETANILAEFAENPATDVPLFYYCTEGFPVAAPENTSGWFVPSTGQMWDCIANFCGGEVAKFLAEEQTDGYDFTYYGSKQTNTPVLETFMKVFELVPAADKDEITMNDSGYSPEFVSFRTSTRYNVESACHFNVGSDEKGLIEGMAGWFDEDGHARPVLAF